jgi:hypothetical protein
MRGYCSFFVCLTAFFTCSTQLSTIAKTPRAPVLFGSGFTKIPSVTGRYLWTIEGFSLLKVVQAFKIEKEFDLVGDVWTVALYPGGSNAEAAAAKFVSFTLQSKSATETKHTFAIVNSQGKPLLSYSSGAVAVCMRAPCGWTKFCARADMFDASKSYLENDTLRVLCTIERVLHVEEGAIDSTVVHVDGRTAPPRLDFVDKLCTDMARLFEAATFYDVRFSVGGRIVRAHKCIVAARSKFFKVLVVRIDAFVQLAVTVHTLILVRWF